MTTDHTEEIHYLLEKIKKLERIIEYQRVELDYLHSSGGDRGIVDTLKDLMPDERRRRESDGIN